MASSRNSGELLACRASNSLLLHHDQSETLGAQHLLGRTVAHQEENFDGIERHADLVRFEGYKVNLSHGSKK